MSGDTTVVGRRLRSVNTGTLVLVLFALGLLGGCAWWVLHLVHGYGHLFEEGGSILATIGGTALFAIALIVAILCLGAVPAHFRRIVIESECPRCGVRAVRTFSSPSDEGRVPTECGHCIAYLRTDGERVREEDLDACDTTWFPFRVTPARYLPAARQDGRTRFVFRMPALCAVCGSPDARERREIGNLMGGTGSVLGEIVGEIVDTELRYAGRSWQVAGPLFGNSTASRPDNPTPEEQRDRALDKLEVPVCARHTEAAAPGEDALKHSNGDLLFASYRYYLEFLALNQIDGPIKESR